MKTIYLAGGCFWGVQKYFDQFDGVISTMVGYANGPDLAPSYEEVCESSGHAETVKIEYDESQISLTDLLKYYFLVIDPTSLNKQGNDTGIQYRTGIYYTDEEQLKEARKVYGSEELKVGEKLMVELEPIRNFYEAEEYHQKYLEKNPNGYCHIPWKLPQHLLEMESILTAATQMIDELEKKIAEFEEFQPKIQKLEAYYTSRQWKDDLAMDEKRELPEKLKRGILSEDGIYNMLERNSELLAMTGKDR